MKHVILPLFLILFSYAFAQHTVADRTRHCNLENGIAIQGYDPVAYFSNTALKGDKKYATNYIGLVYYFSSEISKNYFLKNPSKYEPQYGGWCAFAMGDYGKKVEIDPETFKIVDGKLHLFYNAFFNNTLKSWNKDEKHLKAKADKNWSIYIK
jgi:YHS domain-containing protein